MPLSYMAAHDFSPPSSTNESHHWANSAGLIYDIAFDFLDIHLSIDYFPAILVVVYIYVVPHIIISASQITSPAI